MYSFFFLLTKASIFAKTRLFKAFVCFLIMNVFFTWVEFGGGVALLYAPWELDKIQASDFESIYSFLMVRSNRVIQTCSLS